MNKDIVKRYSNGEITVVWQPSLCVHSGICARGLPKVFDPKRRPPASPEWLLGGWCRDYEFHLGHAFDQGTSLATSPDANPATPASPTITRSWAGVSS